MTKKLFAVEITYKAYVWAEDRLDAERFVSEIVDTEEKPDIQVDEVDSNVLGWDLECCVYHDESNNICLRDVFTARKPPQGRSAWRHPMTDQHPVIPPPKLVREWRDEAYGNGGLTLNEYVATLAAQWGADQELEACVEWLAVYPCLEHPELLIEKLRAARRPQPLSLKEQALADLSEIGSHYIGPGTAERIDTIHRALEALPND